MMVHLCDLPSERVADRITAALNAVRGKTVEEIRDAPWSPEWPTQPGVYWFYGRRFSSAGRELHLVTIRGTASGVACVTEGAFLYQAEGAEGLWKRAILPALPTHEEIREMEATPEKGFGPNRQPCCGATPPGHKMDCSVGGGAGLRLGANRQEEG